MLRQLVFRYNAATFSASRSKVVQKVQRALGGGYSAIFSSSVWSAVGVHAGRHVDEANPSAGGQQTRRWVLPVGHPVWNGSKLRRVDFGPVSASGAVGGGAIDQPAEWRRLRPLRRQRRGRENNFDGHDHRTTTEDHK